MVLKRVAADVASHRTMPLDADARIRFVVEMYRIDPGSLPDNLRSLHHGLKGILGME